MIKVKWYYAAGVLVGYEIYRRDVLSKLGELQLGKNFLLQEFLITKSGFTNIPNTEQVNNITNLVVKFLQPLRNDIRRAIIISSGFRSWWTNIWARGEENSQHLRGEAADFSAPPLTNDQLIAAIVRLGLPFDQLISEKRGDKTWIHVSLSRDPSKNRKQMLRGVFDVAANEYKYSKYV